MMHWRDARRRFETPLAVRDTGASVTKIWLIQALFTVALLLAAAVLA
jgi:hypothetical protein